MKDRKEKLKEFKAQYCGEVKCIDHIPLIIRWSDKTKKETVIEEYVDIVDYQQTLLGLMAIKLCGRKQGKRMGISLWQIDGERKI